MRTLLLIILIVVIVTVYRPRGVWREAMSIWGLRDYVLRVIVTVMGIYFLYGLYTMYERGMLTWDWYQLR